MAYSKDDVGCRRYGKVGKLYGADAVKGRDNSNARLVFSKKNTGGGARAWAAVRDPAA